MNTLRAYVLFALPGIALLSLILYLPVYFFCKRKHGKRPMLRHAAIYGLIGITSSILYATIFYWGLSELSFSPDWHMLNLVPFTWLGHTYVMGKSRMLEQLMLNVVMTVPLGLFLPIVFARLRRWWATALCTAIFITAIETLQYFIGRSADIDDLIMNVTGSILGYTIFALLERGFSKKLWWRHALGAPDDE